MQYPLGEDLGATSSLPTISRRLSWRSSSSKALPLPPGMTGQCPHMLQTPAQPRTFHRNAPSPSAPTPLEPPRTRGDGLLLVAWIRAARGEGDGGVALHCTFAVRGCRSSIQGVSNSSNSSSKTWNILDAASLLPPTNSGAAVPGLIAHYQLTLHLPCPPARARSRRRQALCPASRCAPVIACPPSAWAPSRGRVSTRSTRKAR